jgi:hypothetical protein
MTIIKQIQKDGEKWVLNAHSSRCIPKNNLILFLKIAQMKGC